MVRGKPIDIPQADPLLVSVREAVLQYQLFTRQYSIAAIDSTSANLSNLKSSKRNRQCGHSQTRQHDKPEKSGNKQIERRRRPVVVAVSGGADSICLLHTLVQFQDIWALDLHIAHFNHNLRREASTDAAFVAQTAMGLRLPFHVATAPIGQFTDTPLGIEGESRRFRYRFLLAVAQSITPSHHQPLIAVAHHSDDQTETLLMNLIRGSGLRGLSGMAWHTQWSKDQDVGISVIRPLLNLQRQTIVDFLHRYNLPWLEDATNKDPVHLRNRLRHNVIPVLRELNPNLSATLSRTAETVRAELDRSCGWNKRLFDEIKVTFEGSDNEFLAPRVALDLTQLLALDVAAQRNIVRMALAYVRGNRQSRDTPHSHYPHDALRDVGFDLIERVLEEVRQVAPLGVTHPVAHGIAWTTGNPLGDRPLLSIHDTNHLPFLPQHPLLDEAWRRHHDCIKIPKSGKLMCPYNWVLYSEIVPAETLLPNWQSTKSEWEAYLDASRLGQLYLTTPLSGARIAPLGLGGRHQSIGNLFTNRKIFKPFRTRWPTVINWRNTAPPKNDAVAGKDSQVIWVCGIQIAHFARVTKDTQNVIHLYWNHHEERLG